jgi:hypothetical protein
MKANWLHPFRFCRLFVQALLGHELVKDSVVLEKDGTLTTWGMAGGRPTEYSLDDRYDFGYDDPSWEDEIDID